MTLTTETPAPVAYSATASQPYQATLSLIEPIKPRVAEAPPATGGLGGAGGCRMSNAGEDTSLGSGEDDPTPETAPVADPPTDDRIVDELEEQ